MIGCLRWLCFQYVSMLIFDFTSFPLCKVVGLLNLTRGRVRPPLLICFFGSLDPAMVIVEERLPTTSSDNRQRRNKQGTSHTKTALGRRNTKHQQENTQRNNDLGANNTKQLGESMQKNSDAMTPHQQNKTQNNGRNDTRISLFLHSAHLKRVV